MKKFITIVVIIALTLTAVLTLTGCSKVGICEGCGQRESLVKYIYPEEYGEDPIWVCNDCYRFLKIFS